MPFQSGYPKQKSHITPREVKKVTLTFPHLLSHLGGDFALCPLCFTTLALSVPREPNLISWLLLSRTEMSEASRGGHDEWVGRSGRRSDFNLHRSVNKAAWLPVGFRKEREKLPEANHWANAIVNSWGRKKETEMLWWKDWWWISPSRQLCESHDSLFLPAFKSAVWLDGFMNSQMAEGLQSESKCWVIRPCYTIVFCQKHSIPVLPSCEIEPNRSLFIQWQEMCFL